VSIVTHDKMLKLSLKESKVLDNILKSYTAPAFVISKEEKILRGSINNYVKFY